MTIQIEGRGELLNPLRDEWTPFTKLYVVSGSHAVKPLGLSGDHRLRVIGTSWGGRVEGLDLTRGFLDSTPTKKVFGLTISGHESTEEENIRSSGGIWYIPLVNK